MTRRWLATAAVTAGVVVATALAGGPAAPSSAQVGVQPRVLLASQPAWIPLGGSLPLHVTVTGDTQGLDLRVVVHERITSRIGFDRTVEGEDLGASLLPRPSAPVDSLPLDRDGNRVFTLALQDPAGTADATRVRIRQTGVHPVEVELVDRETGEALHRLVTYLVAIEPATEGKPVTNEPLRVATIWSIVADPAFLPDGNPDPEVLAELRPEGRLGRIAAAVPDDVALTLLPGPETLESWQQLAAIDSTVAPGIDALLGAAPFHQVLAGPYVPLDLPALEAHGLDAEIPAQLALGTDTLTSVLGTRVDPRTRFVDPVDASSLERLRETGADRLVVRPEALGPVYSRLTPARPFLLESGQRLFLSAASDEGLSSLLTGGGEPALDAQRLLAGLALVALEEPSVRRGVVVHTPERWDPPTDLLAALVAGLRGHPLLEPVGIDSLLDDVPVSESDGGGPLVRQLTPVTPGDVAVTAEALAEARRDLDSFRTFVPDDDPRVVRGERALRVVPSSAWAGPAGRARVAAELQMTEDAITELLAGIRAPDGRRVTLTARRAEIPVAFRNETGQTVTVRVVLQSDKLFFPEGAAHVVELPPRTTTVRFSVETRASGTFPLLLTVTATDGHLIVQRARLTIRSTVVSGVGLFLTVGAGLFLVGWWLTHWGRSRRDRRARPAPDGAGGGPGDPGPPGTGSEPVT